ncbi:MAG: ATP-binding protein [Paracoccaceae bacterium]|nr:ATP-binding protein [Paracoccaceae bacterium]MDE2675594.1 ATP-binding protein [Paracoccaceae bacterium]
MIISLSLENWMSFRNKVTFSMIATRERHHGERVPKIKKYKTRVLPIAAIYGGNASGKTNLFKALKFAQRLVEGDLKPEELIPVKPFQLDSISPKKPSMFCFELLINGTIYEFSFVVNRTSILEEKLVVISSSSEKVLYHRREGDLDPNFEKSLISKNPPLKVVFNGTQDNQLFLTNSVTQKIKIFKPVYDWFIHTLKIVTPSTRYRHIEYHDEGSFLYTLLNNMLPQLDTGIAELGYNEIDLPLRLQKPNSVKNILKMFDDIESVHGNIDDYVLTHKKGDILTRRLVTFHEKEDGAKEQFQINQESDGTRRLLELLPTMAEIFVPISKKVYIIDEFDRSLHTHLSRSLLEAYLNQCSQETRTQLLLNTHDVMLMDKKLFRYDEMWVAERDSIGVSNLFSFNEYKDVRNDKDIRRSYLQGRMGGIPNILLGEVLNKSLPE